MIKVKKLNNKGFAVSVILYTASTLIIMVLVLILTILATNEENVSSMSDRIKEQVSGVSDLPTSPTLASQAEIGDFVNYSAGNWTATKAIPTSSTLLTFGGYQSGKSRDTSVTCSGTSNNTYSGWRVFSISGDTVKLIHAGTPECFYHQSPYGSNSERILTGKINGAIELSQPNEAQDFSYYLNEKYASSVSILTKSVLDNWYGDTVTDGQIITDDLIKTGSYYWLGQQQSSNDLWYVQPSGASSYTSNKAYGIRPIITLKPGIKTSGKDENGIWLLPE